MTDSKWLKIATMGAISAMLTLTGCGVETDKKQYSYSFEDNGCKTGKHTFESKSKYCQALRSRDLNNDCANESRLEVHRKECE